MVAAESTSRMRFRRGIEPSFAINPAFLVTATRVPTLSNRSTNRNTKTISSRVRASAPFSFRAPRMSSLKAVAEMSLRL